MICSNCGQDKTPYSFTKFAHLDDGDKFFFMHIHRYPNGNPRNDVCWECNGGYRCLGCGNVKPSSEFRLQGRYCHACKSTWRRPAKYARFATSDSTEGRVTGDLGLSGHEVAK